MLAAGERSWRLPGAGTVSHTVICATTLRLIEDPSHDQRESLRSNRHVEPRDLNLIASRLRHTPSDLVSDHTMSISQKWFDIWLGGSDLLDVVV